jgi:signal transduction histidine kinase
MTLRARLAWTYGVAVAIAVALVAIVSVAAIDAALRTSLDARLRTAAGATAAFVDIHNGAVTLDPEDQLQLRTALGPAMDAALFDIRGTVRAMSSDSVPRGVADVARMPEGMTYYTVGHGDNSLRVAFNPVMRKNKLLGYVAVWAPSDFVDDFERYALVAMTLTALVVGGIVIVLSGALARRALAPLERFTALATEIEAHDLSRRIAQTGDDELGKLAQSFDRMLDRLESAFERQRQFTADASHELRAPLAVIRAEADVALARERSSEEYQRALSTIGLEIERIDALVEALLLAARADSAQIQLEVVDLGGIAMLAAARFTQAAQARSIKIETSLDDASVRGDAASLERAVAALVHNALDFAASRVRVAVMRDGESVSLTIEDDGPGFTIDGLHHATERFWRGDAVRRRGSTGLGLSIVDAVMRVHGGSLSIGNAMPHGALVTMTLRSSGRHTDLTG